ncbi:MAG: UDP-N-acetylglucosamine--N-acetylmuramyl-(pentapeptide) pyrophosphoryl-undecaprenol N-acetylglucosamine transferase [Anaerolineaceae bacterium]|nr:UDP-N-acetylglucosamine--N-acetylmuramyl-(pentapeptide) pyrophosphoryl-undecaprenol N-acetylglucosamine transferase [Anaerolineaceae bacterium]
MRLLICAGGTGGGVYPALNVLRALDQDGLEILWVGGEGGIEADLVQRANVRFLAIPAAGVHGVGLRSLPGNISKLIRGVFASRKILRQFKPDVLFFTGGYVAVPMAVAGITYPSMLFVPDIEPGLALKFIVPFANRVAVPNEASRKFFNARAQKRLVITGYPTHPNLSQFNQDQARKIMRLDPHRRTLIVFGGSKGALSINRALFAILEPLLQRFEVIHISGNDNWEETSTVKEQLPASLSSHYHAYPYLHEEMSAALRSADLIVSRSGASTLGEYPVLGTPAILVPYPYAWRYQKVNADYLVSKNAAILLPDDEMPEKLLGLIMDLFDHPQQLEQMSNNMKSLRTPDAAANLAAVLKQLARPRSATSGRKN